MLVQEIEKFAQCQGFGVRSVAKKEDFRQRAPKVAAQQGPQLADALPQGIGNLPAEVVDPTVRAAVGDFDLGPPVRDKRLVGWRPIAVPRSEGEPWNGHDAAMIFRGPDKPANQGLRREDEDRHEQLL